MQIVSSNYQHKDPHRGWPEKVETFCMLFESSYKRNFANLKQVLEFLGPLKSGTFSDLLNSITYGVVLQNVSKYFFQLLYSYLGSHHA
jgi:hypothetical protein